MALLLDHGARIHAKNNWGKTPRDLAEQSTEVKQLLLHWESKTPFGFYLHILVYIFYYVRVNEARELNGLMLPRVKKNVTTFHSSKDF